ncbi:MAG: SusC/RagA family TonB-linked outer membrane protein [Candidatus Cryptobacteroides sp.]
MKKIITLCIALLFAGMPQVFAQSGYEVKGVVIDSYGPVIGATVMEAGTSVGTSTDVDGSFTLKVSSEDAVVEVSCLGYASRTFKASELPSEISLSQDAEYLEEAVAIGYGSQKKKEVTGSVASIKSEDFNVGVKTNPVGLLQGKVAGLNISRTTADPTQTGYNIQIRGFSTLGQGTGSSPLYIVDGVPTSNIDNISPDEIASMDVLKDGSAAAIYGTRGTNGVILITTKRGEGFSDVAETSLEYSGYANVAFINSRLRMADAAQFRSLSEATGGRLAGMDHGATTDWTRELSRDAAVTHNHNVAIVGSHRKFNYRASLNFKNAEGIAKNNKRSEFTAKFSADQKCLDGWLKLQFDASYMWYRNDFSAADYTVASQLNPTMPVFNEDGTYYAPGNSGQYNPVEFLNARENYGDGNFFRGSIKATVDIKAVPGLKVNAFAAIEGGDNRQYSYNGVITDPNKAEASDWAFRQYDMTWNKLFEGTIDYANNWGAHRFVAVAGFSYQHFMDDGMNASNKGFIMPSLKYYSIGDGDASKDFLTTNSWRNAHALAAGFARVNYNYAEKYLLSASIRAEGSSRFGKNNKWGYFPAVSAGWRIKGEDFMSDAGGVDDLKLRLGFGVTGNNVGKSLMSVALLSKSDVFDYNGKPTSTYAVSQNVNPDLKWEKKYEYNLGLDYAFLNNRLYGSFEVYLRQTKDLLWYYEVPTPPYQYTTLLANAGQMVSYGVELAVTGVPVKKEHFTWTSGLTLAWNRNRITKLSDPEKGFNYSSSPQGNLYGNKFNGSDSYTQILEEGGIVGQWYGYKFLGFNNKGEWAYEDQYGGATPKPTAADKQYLGSAQPAVTFGWNNTFAYKNFDLTIFLRGVIGGKILNASRFMYTPDGTDSSTNYNFFAKDVLSGKGPEKNGGAVFADYNHFSDYWLENGSYLKCDNITLGYTFRFKENKFIRSLRLYLTGTNLFTITGYSGLDPEVNTSCIDYPGVDINNFYPKTASVMFGVNVNFL